MYFPLWHIFRHHTLSIIDYFSLDVIKHFLKHFSDQKHTIYQGTQFHFHLFFLLENSSLFWVKFNFSVVFSLNVLTKNKNSAYALKTINGSSYYYL